jgi:hypothetical protein
MDDEPGLPLTPRQRLLDLIGTAIAAGSPRIDAPAAYPGDLDYDVIEYVEANRTVANGLWLYREADRIVIADGSGPVLSIVRPAVARQAA